MNTSEFNQQFTAQQYEVFQVWPPVHFLKMAVRSGSNKAQFLEVDFHSYDSPHKGYSFPRTDHPLFEIRAFQDQKKYYDIILQNEILLGRLEPVVNAFYAEKGDYIIYNNELEEIAQYRKQRGLRAWIQNRYAFELSHGEIIPCKNHGRTICYEAAPHTEKLHPLLAICCVMLKTYSDYLNSRDATLP